MMTNKQCKQSIKKPKEHIHIYKIIAYIFFSLVAIGVFFTIVNGIYRDFTFKKNGTIIEGHIVNRGYKPRGPVYRLYSYEYSYSYNGVTYKTWSGGYSVRCITPSSSKHKYNVGECVQVIISKENPKISRIYSESSYKCDK